MAFSARQRLVIESNLARDRAETLLARLVDTSRSVQHHNIDHEDLPIRALPSLDRAIASARQLVSILEASLHVAESDLADDDLAILDELAAESCGERDGDVMSDDPEFDVLLEQFADADDLDGSILEALTECVDPRDAHARTNTDERAGQADGRISISPDNGPPGTINRH